MSVLTILSLLKRFWWAPIILGLGLTLAIQRGTIARKDAKIQHYADVMKTNEARVKEATETFRANAESHAREVEAAQNTATQEASGEIEALRSRASALLSAYLGVRRSAAAGGTSGTGQGGGTSHAAGATAGGNALPVLDDGDMLICTENTVKVLGWAAWWRKISLIPR